MCFAAVGQPEFQPDWAQHGTFRPGRVEPQRTTIDVHAADSSGNTALMYAARYGRKDAVAILLTHGADATARDEQGATAADMVRDDRALRKMLERAAAGPPR